jgi:glycine/D-amino acid oxidase-like deaminating enzyme
VIVGAGITGLMAAWSLADSGRDVIVLERSFGTGATSRSGGIVLGETLVGPVPEFDGCDVELANWIADHEIDCDFESTGCLELARDLQLPASPIDWHDAGAVRLVHIVSGGMLDPSRFLNGLADGASRAGARIIDGAAVVGVGASDGGVTLATSQGDMVAHAAVMAVDAWSRTERFDPFPTRMMSFSLETERVDEGTLRRLGLWPRRPFYTQELPLLWGRPTPFGSLIFGREVCELDRDEAMLGRQISEAGDRLAKRVRSLHPALATVNIARVWGGPIGRNVSGVPSFESDPLISGLWWAGGFGGHGLAQAFRLGLRTARALEGTSL